MRPGLLCSDVNNYADMDAHMSEEYAETSGLFSASY